MHSKINQALDSATLSDLSAKFSTAYLIAKKEMPFTRYPDLLCIQRKNGLSIKDTYATDHQCANMIAVIAEDLEGGLSSEISGAQYLSIMADGITDIRVIEHEVVCVCLIGDDG